MGRKGLRALLVRMLWWPYISLAYRKWRLWSWRERFGSGSSTTGGCEGEETVQRDETNLALVRDHVILAIHADTNTVGSILAPAASGASCSQRW